MNAAINGLTLLIVNIFAFLFKAITEVFYFSLKKPKIVFPLLFVLFIYSGGGQFLIDSIIADISNSRNRWF